LAALPAARTRAAEGKIMKILAAMMIVMATPAIADTIAPEDAVAHLGQTITVEGQATLRADKSGISYLDMGGVFPHNSFMAAIFTSNIALFPNLAGYNGKMLDITGTVEQYQGRAEIILTSPSQISAK
jgi:hypothetical protein